MPDNITNQISRYCGECDEHVAGMIVGRVIKCMECGHIVEDHRRTEAPDA